MREPVSGREGAAKELEGDQPIEGSQLLSLNDARIIVRKYLRFRSFPARYTRSDVPSRYKPSPDSGSLPKTPGTKFAVEGNTWRLPSGSVYLEGKPSPEELAKHTAKGEAALAAWKPGPEGFKLLDQLRSFIGSKVVIRAWAEIMYWMEEEGPYPIRARVVDVMTRPDENGYLRAYMVLENPRHVFTPGGGGGSYYIERDDWRWLFRVADLLEIEAA